MNKKFIGLFLAAITITTHAMPMNSHPEDPDWALRPLHKAARDGKVETIRELCEQEQEVNEADDDQGWTPLHWAAANNHAESAQELLHHGAEINTRDDEDWTPLHVAAFNGNVSCFSVLLNNHSDTTLQIRRGPYADLTAEALARKNGHQEILDFFVLEVPVEHYTDIESTPAPTDNLTKITTWLTGWWR